MNDDWLEKLIFGLLALVLIGLSICFILLSKKDTTIILSM